MTWLILVWLAVLTVGGLCLAVALIDDRTEQWKAHTRARKLIGQLQDYELERLSREANERFRP